MTAMTWWLLASEPAQLVPALIGLYVLGQRREIAEEPAPPEACTGPTGLVQ